MFALNDVKLKSKKTKGSIYKYNNSGGEIREGIIRTVAGLCSVLDFRVGLPVTVYFPLCYQKGLCDAGSCIVDEAD